MANLNVPDLIEETRAGIFARHPSRFTLPVLIAPTTPDREAATNRLRRHLVTVACANLKDFAFAFDSSFLAPDSADGFDRLMKLLKLYPGCPISVFGHTDPEGKPAYNKSLSERRARSVFGFLLRRIDVWEHLHQVRDQAAGDRWGKESLQTMAGFLAARGQALPVLDTKAGRAALFAAYMDALAPIDPDTGQPWRLEPDDFLGGAKAKLGEPGDLQGCSEFNPQLVLARQELEGYRKRGKEGVEDRNRANEPNRRVVIYVFEKGTTAPETWPCPAAGAGIGGCVKRFWTDGEERQETAFEAHRRRFGRVVPADKAVLQPPNPDRAERMAREETTFGCRFYHGLALHSPCERDLKMWVLRLWAGGPEAPLANARYAATVGTDPGAPVIRGTTSPSGILGLPVFDDEATIVLRVDAGPVLTPTFADSFDGEEVPKRGSNRSGGEAEGKPTDAPDTPAPGAASPATDSQAWPGEERFMTVAIQGGRLVRIVGPPPEDEPPPDPNPDPGADFDVVDEPPLTREEQAKGAAQRLRNLGFGGSLLETDAAARQAAVRRFQRLFRPDPAARTGELDPETLDQLQRRYGEQIRVESPPV